LSFVCALSAYAVLFAPTCQPSHFCFARRRVQAKARDRSTAEALHDQESKNVELQARLKTSREQALALEVRPANAASVVLS
jgi:hypothetical protein